MAAIWVIYALLPAAAEKPGQDMRELLEVLLYTLCFLAGLVAIPITGVLALATRGKTMIIEGPSPPA